MKTTTDTVRITILGDALCNSPMVKTLGKYETGDARLYDYDCCFRRLKPLLDHSDYVCANLETPLSRDKEMLTKARWQFCTAASFAEAMKAAGVDYVSTANNHCLDRDLKGLRTTLDCLDEIGLDHSGTRRPGEAKKPLIVEIGGIKVGLLSYTYGTNAVTNFHYLPWRYRTAVDLLQEQEGTLWPGDWLVRRFIRNPRNRASKIRNWFHCLLWPQNKRCLWYEWVTCNGYRKRLLKGEIRQLREMGAERLLISLHIGGQLNTEPNAFTLSMTRWLEELGVDFIIANHEHVIHGSKVRADGLTTYAIGDLLGASGTMEEPFDRRCEYSVAVHLNLDRSTKALSRVTFSIIKNILTEEGKLEAWPVADLLPTLDDAPRATVARDALLAARDFAGKDYETVTDEFEL